MVSGMHGCSMMNIGCTMMQPVVESWYTEKNESLEQATNYLAQRNQVVKVPLHDAICCRQHYLPAPTSKASLVQHIA